MVSILDMMLGVFKTEPEMRSVIYKKNGLKVCEQCRYCKLENEDKRDYRTSDRYKCNNPRRLNGFEVDPVTGEISTDELYIVNLVNYQREVAYKEPCYHTNEDGTRLICGKSGNWFEELR